MEFNISDFNDDEVPEAYEEPEVGETTTDRERTLREKVMALAELGEIKYSPKYIKKVSEGTLENIYKDYKRQHLQMLNEQMSELLIGKFSNLLGALKAVEDSDEMQEELLNDKL